MKRIYLLLICVILALVGAIFFINLLHIGGSAVPDPNLFLEVKTDKAKYKINDSVEIQIVGNFGEDKSYIAMSHCRLNIFNIKEGSRGLFFWEEWKSNFDNCPNFNSELELKKVNGTKFLWKQSSCSHEIIENITTGETRFITTERNEEITPGEYKIAFSCGFEDMRGTSWEGIYQGGLSNYTTIKIAI